MGAGRRWPQAAPEQEVARSYRCTRMSLPPSRCTSSLDNYGTHKHHKVKAWLARHPRYHLHFTPTYASWLNQVERWFGLITQRAIRRGSFRTVRELVQRIDTFVTRYNRTATPFTWTATADSILAKVARIAQAINGTRH